MAKIRITNMMFYGFHGMYEYEREQGQKFYVDVEVVMQDDKACETDKLEDGVDMALIYAMVKDVVENKRFTMLMALAAHIGDHILEKYPQAAEVTTRVRKPQVPISGPMDYVEAEATRYQKK
jgi:dihydroneopterin aldolase